MIELHFLHGKPNSKADLRTYNSDFRVQEMLPFAATGEGEHHLLHIRKEGLNTNDVATILSGFAKVHPKEVTYAGQKDKNAITEQWFGVRIPGKETPDWASLNSDQITILSSNRHNKKLRIGALAGNRFTLTLRNVTHMDEAIERLALIKQTGVPNYFGEQRFGHDGKNLVFGRQMFTGRVVKDRKKRSMYLSAVRSYLFNVAVSTRLAEHGLDKLAGDCVMLAGSNSYFTAEQWDEATIKRLDEKDIQLSAPMWGRGAALSQGEAGEFEAKVLAEFDAERDGLEHAGLTQDRRTLLSEPQHLSYEKESDDVLVIKFALPSGCYATSILRELFDYEDVNEREFRARQQARLESAEPESEVKAALEPEVKPELAVEAKSEQDSVSENYADIEKQRIKILVSNDDGVTAPGIVALTNALATSYEVMTVGPDRNCSGASNSLTLTNPLRINTLSNGYVSVSGTPTDCVHLAIRELYTDEPHMVVSGINAGANLGDDTLYSGTVAAAMEGRFLGLPAIAVSLVGSKLEHYDSAAYFTCKIIEGLLKSPIAKDQILNVNVPDLPIEQIKGIKVTRLGARHKAAGMIKTQDPAGKDIFWLGPPGEEQDASEGTDFHAVTHGYVSVTPLKVDLTAFNQISSMQEWINKL